MRARDGQRVSPVARVGGLAAPRTRFRSSLAQIGWLSETGARKARACRGAAGVGLSGARAQASCWREWLLSRARGRAGQRRGSRRRARFCAPEGRKLLRTTAQNSRWSVRSRTGTPTTTCTRLYEPMRGACATLKPADHDAAPDHRRPHLDVAQAQLARLSLFSRLPLDLFTQCERVAVDDNKIGVFARRERAERRRREGCVRGGRRESAQGLERREALGRVPAQAKIPTAASAARAQCASRRHSRRTTRPGRAASLPPSLRLPTCA